MKEIDINELKSIQLDILSALDSFCRENGVNYTISSGTLIGAVRHKGYIPWDDDIDVFMLRSEYEKFVKICPDLLDGKYKLMCLERNLDYCFPYANLGDVRTKMVEDANTGETIVNIDIFPIDDVPGVDEGWHKYLRQMTILYGMKEMKVIHFNRNRSLAKNLFLCLMKAVLCPFSLNWFVKWCNKFAQKNNGQGYEWVYTCSFGPYAKRLPHKKSDYDEYIDLEFEGRTFKAMKGYDDYMTSVYGDYMQLPPVEKRVSTHDYKAWWI